MCPPCERATSGGRRESIRLREGQSDVESGVLGNRVEEAIVYDTVGNQMESRADTEGAHGAGNSVRVGCGFNSRPRDSEHDVRLFEQVDIGRFKQRPMIDHDQLIASPLGGAQEILRKKSSTQLRALS